MRMSKKVKTNQQMQEWIDARRRRHLSHSQVQMARELGLNPANLGKIDKPQAGAVETATAAVHRTTLFRAFWQDDSRQRRVYRGAMSGRRGAKRSETCRQAAACDGQHMKNGAPRPR